MKKKSNRHTMEYVNVRPSTDAGPTTRDRRLVNGQIPTLANRLHISPSKIIRRANIGPTISTQQLGCSRWPNVGRTLICQLRRSTNHADHVPTLDQRLVADWERPNTINFLFQILLFYFEELKKNQQQHNRTYSERPPYRRTSGKNNACKN
jgi:hypothetical protein